MSSFSSAASGTVVSFRSLRQEVEEKELTPAVTAAASTTSDGASMLQEVDNPVSQDLELEEEEEEEEEECNEVLLGSGDYDVVGIQYYNGVAHPGEYVTLVREPQNPYDPNAIRIDNMHQEKIGHIRRGKAKILAPIMDDLSHRVRFEGTIPRHGNGYTLPLTLECYGNESSVNNETIQDLVGMLKPIFKKDRNFRWEPAFQGRLKKNDTSPVVTQVNMDWTKAQEELDNMFDKQMSNHLKDLPQIPMPQAFTDITLFDYQIQGIRWLVKQETCALPSPFFKEVEEKGKQVYLCEITQSSQPEPPKPVQGSILCDAMGLGKSIQALGLILSAPPPGVNYTPPHLPPPPTAGVPVAAATTQSSPLLRRRISYPNATKCTLIVCPVSVISNWIQQVESHIMPGILNIQIYHGQQRHTVDIVSCDILLASYHTLVADFGNAFTDKENVQQQQQEQQQQLEGPRRKKTKRQTVFDFEFHRIILDEAHTIRSSKTRFFKAVQEIKANHKLCLTGTPFVNKAEDVYSLLKFLGLEPLDSQLIFKRAITKPIQNGNELGLARLRTCMGFVSLRRSKQGVNVKMQEKTVKLARVEWPTDNNHKAVYDALYGTLKVALTAILKESPAQAISNYSCIFEKLLRLRQACCSGTLVSKERRELALNLWKQVSSSLKPSLTAQEGLELLDKLKGAFSQEENTECGICLCEMEPNDGTILKSCSHIFCKLCIHQVLAKSNGKCPYCRCNFTEGDVVDMSLAQSAVDSTTDSDLDEKGRGDDFETPPKIAALLEAIKTMQDDEKGVIFSQFTKYLDLIGAALKAAGYSYVRIDGSVPAQKRIECIRRFNNDESEPRFILCSLLASGTGINLTRGNYAFMMDCWWNEAVESQAMDRIHRISQTRHVHVLRFVMKDSIEERIVKLQEVKSIQAKGVLQKLKGDEKRKALLGDLKGLLELDEE